MVSIRVQLFLAYAASLLLPLLLLVVAQSLTWMLFFPGRDQIALAQLELQASRLAEGAEEALQAAGPAGLVAWVSQQPSQLRLRLIEAAGTVIYDSHGPVGGAIDLTTVYHWLRDPGRLDGWYYKTKLIEFANGEPWGVLAVAAPEEMVTVIRLKGSSQQDLIGTAVLVLAVILTLGGSLMLYWRLGSSFVLPLRQLSKVVSRLAKGDLNAHVPLNRRDELGQLAQNINVMIDQWRAAKERAEAAELARRYWVAAASHDLRSPLTVILGQLEALRRRASDEPTQLNRRLAIIETKAHQLDQLVSSLFELAALDAQSGDWPTEKLDLAELVRLEAISFLTQLEERQLELISEIPEYPCWVEGAPDKLIRALQNLLHNALVHGSAGSQITVRLLADGTDWRVEVNDQGVGLNEAEIPDLFERFVQGNDPARGKGGGGLGLAIVKEVIQRHRGQVGAVNLPGGGASFWFTLPALPAE